MALRKFLVGSAVALGVFAAACTTPSSTDTTPTLSSHDADVPTDIEAELEGARVRSGLLAKEIVFQAVAEVLTFQVYATCEGEIEKSPDGTKYLVRVFQLEGRASVIDTSFPAGGDGHLSREQLDAAQTQCAPR